MGRQVKKVNNIIRLILSIIFLFTQLGIDIRPVHSAMPQILPLPNPSEITIPEAYGKITEVFKGDSDKLVFHIQDLHTNPEAQLNASKIMEYLIDTYGIKLLTIEGEAGHIDPEWLANVSLIKIINDKMAEIFLNSGEMTGEEYLYVTRYPKYKDVVFRGIEDKDSYWKNREVFNKMYPRIRENMRLCDNIKGSLDKLKKVMYPEAAVELDEKRSAYEAGELEVKDYTSYLVGLAKEKNINISKYENFSILSKLVEIQERLEFSKVDKERTLLFDALSKALSEEHAKAMMEKVKEHNEGKLTAIEFYTYLKELAANNNIDFTQYSNIITYMEYISTSDRLDNTHLFKELEQVEDAITEAYLTADEQKQLARLSKNLSIMKKFFDINLSNEDLDYYQKNKDEFKVQAFVDFIKEKAKQHNVRISTDPSLSQLDKTLVEQDEFYKVVLVRDEAMVKNTLKRMEEFNANITIQPIGGFHTKGMAKMYKEQGISYVVISPHVTKEFDEENYRDILQNKKKSPEELVSEYSEKLRPEEFSTQHGAEPKAVAVAINLTKGDFVKSGMPEDSALEAALATINPQLVEEAAKIEGIKDAVKAIGDEEHPVNFDGLTDVEKEFYKSFGIDLSDVIFVTGFGIVAAGIADVVAGRRKVHRWWGLAAIVYKDKSEGPKAARFIKHYLGVHEARHMKNPTETENEVYTAEMNTLLGLPKEEREMIADGAETLLKGRAKGEEKGNLYLQFLRAAAQDDIEVARTQMDKLITGLASASESIARTVEAQEAEALSRFLSESIDRLADKNWGMAEHGTLGAFTSELTALEALPESDQAQINRVLRWREGDAILGESIESDAGVISALKAAITNIATDLAKVTRVLNAVMKAVAKEYDGFAKAQEAVPADLATTPRVLDAGVLIDNKGIPRDLAGFVTEAREEIFTQLKEKGIVYIVNTTGLENEDLERLLGVRGVGEIRVIKSEGLAGEKTALSDAEFVILEENLGIFRDVLGRKSPVIVRAKPGEVVSLASIRTALAANRDAILSVVAEPWKSLIKINVAVGDYTTTVVESTPPRTFGEEYATFLAIAEEK